MMSWKNSLANPTLTAINNLNTTMTTLASMQINNQNPTLTINQTLQTSTRDAVTSEDYKIPDNVTSEAYRIPFFWINFGMGLESIIAACFNVVALRIMMQCRKLPMSIRYLSSNFLVAVLVSSCNNFIHSAIRFFIGLNGDFELFFESRAIFYSLFVALTLCSVCALALERFIALVFPLHYTRYITKATLLVTIGLIWSINLLVTPLIVFFKWLDMCGKYDFVTSCDRYALLRPLRIFMASLSCIITCITIFIYVKICFIISRQERELAALTVTYQNATPQNESTSRLLPSTNIILTITSSVIILQTPYLFNFIIFEVRSDLKMVQFRALLQLVLFILGEINTYIILYLYVWRLKECKMNFYRMLSKLSDRYKLKAEALRIEVFNIVTLNAEDIKRTHQTSSI